MTRSPTCRSGSTGARWLEHDDEDGRGYLRSVLKALDVPVESQSLVFTPRRAFSTQGIAPHAAPGGFYFNDEVYVGYVRGGDVLEFSAADPTLGATFYLLDQEPTERPRFVRQTDSCLQCHPRPRRRTCQGVVRSVFPDLGFPVFGEFVRDRPREPDVGTLKKGWYVTGTRRPSPHAGNVMVTDREHPENLDRARQLRTSSI
ncbi:MAG: hypothetical protein U0835_16265 [Isosphaeraceae bacterium]